MIKIWYFFGENTFLINKLDFYELISWFAYDKIMIEIFHLGGFDGIARIYGLLKILKK